MTRPRVLSQHLWKCVAVCCSVLQLLQCVAVCCSVLQCVAVCGYDEATFTVAASIEIFVSVSRL
jgi:hypothetical protein